MQLHGPYGGGTDDRRCFVLDCSPSLADSPQAATLLVAIIAAEAPSERRQETIAREAANLTIRPQRFAQRAQVFLYCGDREGSRYDLRLRPYWTPDPVDVFRLASDALESAASRVERLGHFRFGVLDGRVQVIAWRGRFAGATSAIYEIGQDGDLDSSPDAEEFYFYLLMAHIAAVHRDWERITTWLIINRAHVGEPLLLDIRAVDVPADVDPRRLAEALVKQESFVVEKDGTRYFTAGDGDGVALAAVTLPNSAEPPLMASFPAGQPVHSEMTTDLAALRDLHARSYLPAVEQCAAEGDWEAAYGYYLNHLRLTKFAAGEPLATTVSDAFLPRDPKRAVEYGLTLANLLLRRGAADYAEGIAASASEFARSWGHDALAVELLASAGMSATTLGRFREAQDHLERALRIAGSTAGLGPRIRAGLHWHLAKCLLWRHMGLEAAGRTKVPPILQADLAAAEAALAEADRLYEQEGAEDLPIAALIIAIYRTRIDDLRGEHVQALADIRDLLARSYVRQDVRLRSAAMIFETLALLKLHRANRSWSAQYGSALKRFVIAAADGPHDAAIEAPWLAVGLTLAAEELIAQGESEAAVVMSGYAYSIQQAVASQQVRSPGPGQGEEGWLGIPMLDRLNAALHLHAVGPGGSRTLVAALVEREAAKSRWFQRDFGMRRFASGHTPTVLKELEKGLRRAYTGNTLDTRELYASIRLLQHQEGLSPQSGGNDQGKSFNPEALTRLPIKTAFVSLYADREQTYVSVIRGRREPEVIGTSIEFSRERLQCLAACLQTHLSGTGLYPPIDPKDPWRRHDRYLAELDHLQQLVRPLAEVLRDMDLVVLSPHSYWHNIPIHALLATHLSELDVLPGITHVPSLNMLSALHEASAISEADIVNAAVFTAPGLRDNADLFARCHERVVRSLIGAGLPTQEAIGPDATEAAFTRQHHTASLQHVIAHGYFNAGSQVMRSGLLLGTGEGFLAAPNGQRPLATAWQMANITSGVKHLTLQACSLGRSIVASADEQWGVSRGALAAGIPSILAPMWNVDLLSSSFTSECFYDYWQGRSMPKWTALTMAQRDTSAAAPSWSHPYHWAAFKLIGL
ncbi:CHAT domain-containing protein [Micromonospora sp. Mcm103]|uniref:CHAT domain-containing protein n=1 Tax=Micromonospora sp. Mcm103 TaxID=2926015 RepID=UPI0021CA77BF|nr:CHAT domain-containing protein [Micromonospora sp. Mcm103]